MRGFASLDSSVASGIGLLSVIVSYLYDIASVAASTSSFSSAEINYENNVFQLSLPLVLNNRHVVSFVSASLIRGM